MFIERVIRLTRVVARERRKRARHKIAMPTSPSAAPAKTGKVRRFFAGFSVVAAPAGGFVARASVSATGAGVTFVGGGATVTSTAGETELVAGSMVVGMGARSTATGKFVAIAAMGLVSTVAGVG